MVVVVVVVLIIVFRACAYKVLKAFHWKSTSNCDPIFFRNGQNQPI